MDVGLARASEQLNIGTDLILEYLKNVWRKDKYQNFLGKENAQLDLSNKIGTGIKISALVIANKKNLILLAILVLIVYANGLGNEFTSDSKTGILLNPNIKDLKYAFHDNLEGGNSIIRYLIFSVFGATPFYYRIINIFAHIVSVGLLYLIVLRLSNVKTALFTSLLFAVHPILTESVTWIAGSPYSISAIFLLGSFLIFLIQGKKLIISILFICAMLFSNKIFIMVSVFLVFGILFGSLLRSIKKTYPLFIATVGYIVLLFFMAKTRVAGLQSNYYQDASLMNPLYQVPIAITEYLKLIFWPAGLTLYHSEMSFSQLEYLIRLSIFILFIGIIVFSYVRARGGFNKALRFWERFSMSTPKWSISQEDFKYIFFWLSFFLIALSPTLTPFGISWIVAERYVYLGSVGIFAVVGLIFSKFSEKKSIRPYIYAVFALIIIALSVRTIIRNRDWKNEDTLWFATAKTSPSSSQNHNNLGDLYSRHEDLQKAAEEFQTAIDLKPGYADAYHNLANTYQQMAEQEIQKKTADISAVSDGEEESAETQSPPLLSLKAQEYLNLTIQNYLEAVRYNPSLWQSYQNLGVIYFNIGELEKAREMLQKAYEINPQNPNLIYALAMVDIQSGAKEKARSLLEILLQADPGNAQVSEALKLTY